MTLLALDTFDRADTTAGLGSLDSGGAWTSANGTWGIIDNQAYSPTSVGADPGNIAVTDVGAADVDVEVNVSGITTSVTGALAGLVFRYSDNANFWRFVVLRTGDWFLHKFAGGTRTNVATGVEGTSVGVIYRAVLSGSSITLIRNDIEVYSTTDAHNSTATKHGITRQANAPWRLDNFVAYDTGTRPSVIGSPLTETFTASDTRLFTKLADSGQTWDRRAGLPGIIGNEFYNAGASAASIIVFDTATADHDIAAELRSTSASGAAGVVARYSDFKNYWRGIFDNGGTVLLQKQVGGTFTTYSTGVAWAVGDVLKLDCVGSTINLYRNGTLVASQTDTFNQTATLAGVIAQVATGWRLDNVTSGVLLLGPTVGYIGPGLMA